MLAFFRWFCRPDCREDIEGDLLERFYKRKQLSGFRKANWLFIKDVLLLLRPGIININTSSFNNMKTANWIKPASIHLLLVVIIILPFMPGPSSNLVIGLSILGQITGFLGLVLVPVGIAWTIAEVVNRKRQNTTINRNLSYGFAISAIVLGTIIYLLLLVSCFVTGGVLTGISALLPGVFVFYKVVKSTRKLKTVPGFSFNRVPLYLITVPLLALGMRTFVVGPVSKFSRDFAIKRSEQLIASIEQYKERKGRYPESLVELGSGSVPQPFIMGVKKFRYNKIDDQYSISFSQWLEFGSLEEIVLYDKTNLRCKFIGIYAKYDYEFDLCRIKGAFAIYDTPHTDWRYYHVD
jgi:hypothetical protein